MLCDLSLKFTEKYISADRKILIIFIFRKIFFSIQKHTEMKSSKFYVT